MRVLSVVHDPAHTGGGGLFEKVVAERGDTLDRWVVADGEAAPGEPSALGRRHGLRRGDAPRPGRGAPLARRRGRLHRRGALPGRPDDRRLPRGAARRAGGRGGRRPRRAARGRLVHGRAERRRRPRPGRGRPPAARRRLPVALLHLRASRRRRAARRERERAAGVPARRPDVGDPVPRRGRAPHARPLVRRGRATSSRSRGDEIEAETDRLLGGWNAHGRALCGAFLDEAARLG